MISGPKSRRPVADADAVAPSPAAAVRPEGWLELVRFRQWAHFLVLPLAGVELEQPSLRGGLALARGVLIAAFVLAFGYLANALGDREMDRDPAKNPLVHRREDDRRLALYILSLACAALALAATGPPVVAAAAACCIFSGWAYSLGPRLKAKPFLGTLMNAGNFAPLLLMGVASVVPDRIGSILPTFVALLLQNQLLHEAADAPEDRGGGVCTTLLAVGPRGAALLAAACGFVVVWVAMGVVTQRGWPIALALVMLVYVVVFPALLARDGRSPERMARWRVAHRWAAAATGALILVLDR
jgi:4-hydroxybenzoate polyprenyltransferase